MKNILRKISKNSERGQAIILIAFAIIGMVGIVGLMIDSGILLIDYARLKRGIDSASIAAAAQFRKSFTGDEMQKAGEELLKFNQSDAQVTIFTCAYPPNYPYRTIEHPLLPIAPADKEWHLDETLCKDNTGGVSRKLVRITASQDVYFGFMKILGFTKTTIAATSIGEAASVDMVLLLDTSSSMAYETTGNTDRPPNYTTICPSVDCVDPDRSDPSSPGHPFGDDPKICNSIAAGVTGECQPMATVKKAAKELVDQLFFPYDRVAIVTLTGQATNGTATRKPSLIVPPTGEQFMENLDTSVTAAVANTEIQDKLAQIKVFQPKDCINTPTDPFPGTSPLPGPCLLYNDDPTNRFYIGQPCPPDDRPAPGDPRNPTSCGASNTGGALKLAGEQFAYGRQDSFWVVIALMGGPPNAAVPRDDPADSGWCPTNTYAIAGMVGYCRDLDPMPASFNSSSYAAYNPLTFNWSTYDPTVTIPTRHSLLTDPSHYDADDYLRDSADYITAPSPAGQGATLFAVCTGKPCRNYRTLTNYKDPASGELLGIYMAKYAGGTSANHGEYYYAAAAADLGGPNGIFMKIAKNILTRIAQ